MFSKRRAMTADEFARLIKSFDVPSESTMLAEAKVSEIATIAELGSLHTVLVDPDAPPGTERHYTVAQLAASWARGGSDPVRDQESYRHAVTPAADPAFAPELLFAPTRQTTSGWWLFDGIHRAAALHTVRTAAGVTNLALPVFVLPRPVQ